MSSSRTRSGTLTRATAAAGGEQAQPLKLPPGPRLGPGSGSGATVGGVRCGVAGPRCMNSVASLGGGRQPCGRYRRQFGARVVHGHACLLPGKGRDEVSLFRASSRGRARGAAGGRIAAARLARLIARARRRTHLARRFPPGSFSQPPAVAFCRKAERRPRKPPLSTFILHHTAKCQAHPGTENENPGYFARNAGRNEAWIDALRPFPSPRTPIRGPASVPAAVSAVELVLRRLRQLRESGSRIGSGMTTWTPDRGPG